MLFLPVPLPPVGSESSVGSEASAGARVSFGEAVFVKASNRPATESELSWTLSSAEGLLSSSAQP